MKILLLLFVGFVHGKGCYWNATDIYPYYGTKTPYETVRGDIRDHQFPQGCEAISVWTINRHGNRNPGYHSGGMKEALKLKDEIVASFEAGKGELCAQDIEDIKLWTWKVSDDAQALLTKSGYDEIYNIGKRFAQKYHHLLQGTPDQFYVRGTSEQRSIASCTGLVHGMTDIIPSLNVTIGIPLPKDDVMRPYETCDRYLREVKVGKVLFEQEANYVKSSEFIAVQNAVQKRLGISTVLTAENVLSFYKLCQTFRPWSDDLKCPWCALFSNNDLVVMEYSDDVDHYWRKGYGSWMNAELGKAPLKDLYESFEAVVNGGGRKLVTYMSHNTMLAMIYCALGLYSDEEPLQGASRDSNRQWRTSLFGASSSNLMAVLNRCRHDEHEEFRVQFFINEKVTPLCPAEGCSWRQFQEKFQPYTTSDLSFCQVSNSKQESFYPHAKSTN